MLLLALATLRWHCRHNRCHACTASKQRCDQPTTLHVQPVVRGAGFFSFPLLSSPMQTILTDVMIEDVCLIANNTLLGDAEYK